MRVLTIFSLFLLGLTLSFTISSSSSAQTRSDYLGAYRDWMLPTRTVALKPVSADTQKSIAKVTPRTDYWGPGDSGSFYDFYLDWMLPRVKTNTPRTIPFLERLLSRQILDVDSQVVSLDNNK